MATSTVSRLLAHCNLAVISLTSRMNDAVFSASKSLYTSSNTEDEMTEFDSPLDASADFSLLVVNSVLEVASRPHPTMGNLFFSAFSVAAEDTFHFL